MWPSYWDGYGCCQVLEVPTPLVFGYNLDVMLRWKPGEGVGWFVTVVEMIICSVPFLEGPRNEAISL